MEFDKSILSQRPAAGKPPPERDHKQRVTFHCEACSVVLGDSLGVCGEVPFLDSILFIRVTDDVVISEDTESGRKGEMASCIYSSVKCRGCHRVVGKVIHSASSHLAAIRSMFLLHKPNISCYILDSSSVVKASTLSFNLEPLRESMNKMEQMVEAQLDQISLIQSRLSDRSVSSKLVK